MEKINIAELLKDCPPGMELDCMMFDNAKFIGVENYEKPICIRIGNGDIYLHLTKFGTWSFDKNAKCVIFPKGKTTWEGFNPPCKFKDGDIVATNSGSWIGITTGGETGEIMPTYCVIKYNNTFEAYLDVKNTWCFSRLATEEEKQKLFQAIKDNGYEWNEETKTLEKLVGTKFHIGTWVVFNNQPEKGSIYQIKNTHNYEYKLQHILGGSMPVPFSQADILRLWTIDDAKDGDVLSFYSEYKGNKMVQVGIIEKYVGKHGGCSNTFKIYVGVNWDNNLQMGEYMGCSNIYPATKEQRDLLFQKIKEAGYKWNVETKTLEKLVKPIFKAGNKVRNKNNHNVVFTITSIEEDYYVCGAANAFWFMDQDNYELVPNKFDINTLEPYDKVLVRLTRDGVWHATFFSHYDRGVKWGCYPFVTTSSKSYSMCIPYIGNEHLRGTTNDCDEYYKTW